MRMDRLRAAAAAAVLAGVGYMPSASAQAWIGQIAGDMVGQAIAAQREQACMIGTPMSDSEVAEARAPALAVMPAYFASAGADGRISTHFNLDKRARWIDGEASVGMAELDRQRDPFARTGLSLDPAPIAFVRAGDGSSALGQWTVRDAPGSAGGTYTARFTRSKGAWRLSTLQLAPARQYVDPVEQYCHSPGDVLPYRLQLGRALREQAERRVAKAKGKVAKADAAATKARDKAAAEARLQTLRAALDSREVELGVAQAAEARAQADAAAAEARKAAAIAALAAGG